MKEEWKEAGLVFLGEVADMTDHEDGTRLVQFQVLDAWKGACGRRVAVQTWMGGGDCGYPFVIGERYLVYARWQAHGFPYTSVCSRTKPASSATDDLAALGRSMKESGTPEEAHGLRETAREPPVVRTSPGHGCRLAAVIGAAFAGALLGSLFGRHAPFGRKRGT